MFDLLSPKFFILKYSVSSKLLGAVPISYVTEMKIDLCTSKQAAIQFEARGRATIATSLLHTEEAKISWRDGGSWITVERKHCGAQIFSTRYLSVEKFLRIYLYGCGIY